VTDDFVYWFGWRSGFIVGVGVGCAFFLAAWWIVVRYGENLTAALVQFLTADCDACTLSGVYYDHTCGKEQTTRPRENLDAFQQRAKSRRRKIVNFQRGGMVSTKR
jgi:hypothetical protein